MLLSWSKNVKLRSKKVLGWRRKRTKDSRSKLQLKRLKGLDSNKSKRKKALRRQDLRLRELNKKDSKLKGVSKRELLKKLLQKKRKKDFKL